MGLTNGQAHWLGFPGRIPRDDVAGVAQEMLCHYRWEGTLESVPALHSHCSAVLSRPTPSHRTAVGLISSVVLVAAVVSHYTDMEVSNRTLRARGGGGGGGGAVPQSQSCPPGFLTTLATNRCTWLPTDGS